MIFTYFYSSFHKCVQKCSQPLYHNEQTNRIKCCVARREKHNLQSNINVYRYKIIFLKSRQSKAVIYKNISENINTL